MPQTADYTIQGFLYQFNKTAMEILKAQDDDTITAEGIVEDVEVTSPAMLTASSAVDATAAKLYGRSISNNKRYKRFLRDKMPIVTRFGFPGIQAGGIRIKCINIPDLRTDQEGYVGIEDILYHTLRCGLLHQCEIDARIEFVPETYIGDFSEKFRLPHHVIFGLLLAVVLDECNAVESVPSDIQVQIDGQPYSIENLWGVGGH